MRVIPEDDLALDAIFVSFGQEFHQVFATLDEMWLALFSERAQCTLVSLLLFT